MKIRIDERTSTKGPIERYLDAAGFEVIGGPSGAEVDIAVVVLDDDPTVSNYQVRGLLTREDATVTPTVVIMNDLQIGHEITLSRQSNVAICKKPMCLASLARSLESWGRTFIATIDHLNRSSVVLWLSHDRALDARVWPTFADDECRVLTLASPSDVKDYLRQVRVMTVVIDARACSSVLSELVAGIRSIDQDVSILVLGDQLGDVEVRDILKAGADDFAPISRDESRLGSMVVDLIKQRGIRMRKRELGTQVAAKQLELQRVNDDLKTINRAVTEANLRLERQGHFKDEILGMAAHELKSPLSAICGALDILCTSLERLSATDSELLVLIQRNAIRMTKLVNDILDLSRVEAGKVAVHRRPTSIAAVLDQTISGVTLRAREKGVQIALPDRLPDRLVQVDEVLIVQILVNLIDNAIKFSPPGGVVRVHVMMTRRELHFVIQDTGPGIPESERHLVFERFFRKARGTDAASAGSGLGLTITRALTELLNGRISLGESAGKGCQFTVTLPLDPAVALTP